MKNKSFKILALLGIVTIISCSETKKTIDSHTAIEPEAIIKPTKKTTVQNKKPHQYGGWYCPDNLRGFPPVDINN